MHGTMFVVKSNDYSDSNGNVITNVSFRQKDNIVVAFFVDTVKGMWLECYAHIGQHSMATVRYHNSCEKAKRSNYLPLLNELHYVGYKNIKVVLI